MQDMGSRITEIITLLKEEYSDNPKTALHHSSPFELLVATILSAQSTDVMINRITKDLFKKYRGPEDFANAPIEELERDIKSSGFYRNKARNIKKTSRILVEKFNSNVPRTMEELITLPGVARKTANIVLANSYGILVGIAVDTHVRRLSQRLGLTENNDPNKIERDLMEIVPQEEWSNFSHLLIFHGREVCNARKPRHDRCVLYHLCPSREI